MERKLKNAIRREIPNALLIILDIVLINLACFLALYLRMMEQWSGTEAAVFLNTLKLCCIPGTVIALTMLFLFRVYGTVWEYAGEHELVNIAVACICSSALYTLFAITFRLPFPRSLPYFYAMLLFVFVSGSRLLLRRVLKTSGKSVEKSNPKKRTLIVGAGTAGAMAIREFDENSHSRNKAVCLIDDDPAKLGTRVRGVKVVGGREKIGEAAKRFNVEEILFCIPSATNAAKNELLELCSQTGAEVKTLPSLSQIANGEVTLSLIKNVSIEDLLGRTQVHTSSVEIAGSIRGNTVLVTGGGGSIGSELCRQLAALEPCRLIVFDIYENNAYFIQQELKKNYPKLDLVVLIGSVRDEARVRGIFETYRPSVVCHAAAHKHVPLMEDSPAESIKNNVFGTYNVAKAAGDFGTSLFILISTDKAVNPTNVMGASKRLCEMIVQSMNGRSKTRYVAVRFGNVLGSNGSVIPLFKKQIAEGGPVTVTDKRVTRFFMTIPEAVSLILQAGAFAEGGEVFVLDMGSPVRIDDMARKMIRLSGFEPDVDIKIEYTGLRPGEKLYEELLLQSEGLQKTPNHLIFIGHQRKYSLEEIDGKMETLRSVLYAPNPRVRECMLSLIHEPADESYSRIPVYEAGETVEV